MTTPSEFIETWPFYTRADIIDFNPPASITRMCRHCQKETTWSRFRSDRVDLSSSPHRIFWFVAYSCVLCAKECPEDNLLVLYQKLDWKEVNAQLWQHHGVKKIGQEPPQSIEIPADLSKRLGATAGYYRNALLCRAHGLGIAAVAYMRRVVEEQTDELIDVVADLALTYEADEKTVRSLMAAKERVRYEEKLEVASKVMPSALMPGGVNPIAQLYIHLSVGLHGKTDDECIAIFDDLKADFEYVFRNLHVQALDRREFAQRVKERAARKS